MDVDVDVLPPKPKSEPSGATAKAKRRKKHRKTCGRVAGQWVKTDSKGWMEHHSTYVCCSLGSSAGNCLLLAAFCLLAASILLAANSEQQAVRGNGNTHTDRPNRCSQNTPLDRYSRSRRSAAAQPSIVA